MPCESMTDPVELRVRPLAPAEYALWQTDRGLVLGLPSRPGATEVGVLVYGRTGPVANALIRTEPDVRLTAEIRILDVLEPLLAGAVVTTITDSFVRGGYGLLRAWALEANLAPFLSAGFAVVGVDLVLDLGVPAAGWSVGRPSRGLTRGLARGSSRVRSAFEIRQAEENEWASFLAWLFSARTTATLPRTLDRATVRAMRNRPDEHFLVLTEGQAVVGDLWVSVVEAARDDGSSVSGAVVRALRLRSGLHQKSFDRADAGLRTWASDHGLGRIDAHVPATVDPRVVEMARARGFRDAGTQLERIVEESSP